MTKFQLENYMIVLGVDRNQWPTMKRDLIIANPTYMTTLGAPSYLRFSKQGKDSYTVTAEQL